MQVAASYQKTQYPFLLAYSQVNIYLATMDALYNFFYLVSDFCFCSRLIFAFLKYGRWKHNFCNYGKSRLGFCVSVRYKNLLYPGKIHSLTEWTTYCPEKNYEVNIITEKRICSVMMVITSVDNLCVKLNRLSGSVEI